MYAGDAFVPLLDYRERGSAAGLPEQHKHLSGEEGCTFSEIDKWNCMGERDGPAAEHRLAGAGATGACQRVLNERLEIGGVVSDLPAQLFVSRLHGSQIAAGSVHPGSRFAFDSQHAQRDLEAPSGSFGAGSARQQRGSGALDLCADGDCHFPCVLRRLVDPLGRLSRAFHFKERIGGQDAQGRALQPVVAFLGDRRTGFAGRQCGTPLSPLQLQASPRDEDCNIVV